MGTPRALTPLERVYLVCWWFAPIGGLERHVTELARALWRQGVGVWVFSETPVPRKNQYRQELELEGIPLWSPKVPAGLVRRVRSGHNSGLYRRLCSFYQFLSARLQRPRPPMSGGKPSSAPALLAQAMEGSVLSFRLQKAMDKLAERDRPDVVHVHGFRLGQSWVVPWAVMRGLPVVYTEHGTISDWGAWHRDAARHVAGAGEIACMCARSCESLAALMPGRNIAVHRHLLRTPAWVYDQHPPGKPVRLVCVARLRREKGLDVLLRAAARVRKQDLDFRLVIVGEGPDRAELERLRDDLDLGRLVEFAGRHSAEGVAQRLREAEVFVLASRAEALPLALLEAMSHGLAIVATDAGGIPEMIRHDETGLLVPVGSAEALGDALERVIRNGEERVRLRRAARAVFEQSPHHEDAALQVILASYERARRAVEEGHEAGRDDS